MRTGMKTLDTILRSADYKPEVTWAVAVFKAMIEEIELMHMDNMLVTKLVPAWVEVSDDKEAPVQVEIKTWVETASEDDIYYRAPELSTHTEDERSDYFSATAIFYALLTGRAPWGGTCNKVNGETQRNILLKWERTMHPLDMTRVPEALRPIVERGLAIDPNARFQTSAGLMEAIDSLDPEALKPAPEPEAEKEAQPVQREDPIPLKSTHRVPEETSVKFDFRKGKGNGFKDIAGMQELKDLLADDVLYVFQNAEQAKRYRLTIPNGMLLYGPPGCGKTYLAEKFAEEAGVNYVLVKASDLGSPYIHGTQEKIAQLFHQAKDNAPVVICLDEFDAMAPDRSSRSGENVASEVNEFLSQLNNCSDSGIFVIALTNRPDKLDPAILRSGRFDKKIYVPLPDKDARREIFSIHLKDRPCDESVLDLDKLSELSDGYVGSDIALIVNDAARKAARRNQLITEELLEDTLRRTPPSLKKDMLKYYNRIHIQMEKGQDARPAIGFQ